MAAHNPGAPEHMHRWRRLDTIHDTKAMVPMNSETNSDSTFVSFDACHNHATVEQDFEDQRNPSQIETQPLSKEERKARRRYLLFAEYVGTEFSGSQRQPDGVRTVQGAFEKALCAVTKQVGPNKPVHVNACVCA